MSVQPAPDAAASGPTSLSELVAAAVAGDNHAWAALVDRFAPLVWSIAHSFQMSATDRDDVTQSIWLRLLEHLPSIREPEALAGWLVTTSRRECLRHLGWTQKRATRETAIIEDNLPQALPDLDELMLRAERRDALRADFASLGERCRQLLTMLFGDPREPYEVISATLQMPVGSIGPTRARCLQRLRSLPATSALLERSDYA